MDEPASVYDGLGVSYISPPTGLAIESGNLGLLRVYGKNTSSSHIPTGSSLDHLVSAASALMWLLRVFPSVVFLFSIIITVPLAFDIGGRACGLAFSLGLSSFYFGYSILRIATPEESRFRSALIKFIAWTQWAILPTLLIWSLNRFSVDSIDNGSWVERTFSGKRANDVSAWQWILGVDGLAETVTVGVWDKFLVWSTPVFQLCEGFCSLLVIQAAGQITRWLVNSGERTDSWMVR